MSKFLAGARRPALCLVSIASMLAGGITLWAMLDPESVRNASTWLLLSVLALLALPLLTLAAFATDQRNRAERALARRSRQFARAASEEAASIAVSDIRVIPVSAPRGTTETDAPARRHEPVAQPSVSARRAARSAPGRSRGAIRR
jgi:hypothetical protein